MADRFTIQRFPTGLLAALGMQNSGDTPSELSGNVMATFDVTRLYLLDRAITQQSTVAGFAATPGQSASAAGETTVPNGEIWLVWSSEWFTGTVPVGASGQLQLLRRIQSSVPTGFNLTGPPKTIAAGGQYFLGQTYEVPQIWRPGDQPYAAWENGIFAAGLSGVFRVHYTPLKV